MFTASHNPAAYNGIKMCRVGAQPIGMETGLAEIRDAALAGDTPVADRLGEVTRADVLEAYAEYLLKLAPVEGAPAQGRHRRRQRDGRADGPRGLRGRRW